MAEIGTSDLGTSLLGAADYWQGRGEMRSAGRNRRLPRLNPPRRVPRLRCETLRHSLVRQQP